MAFYLQVKHPGARNTHSRSMRTRLVDPSVARQPHSVADDANEVWTENRLFARIIRRGMATALFADGIVRHQSNPHEGPIARYSTHERFFATLALSAPLCATSRRDGRVRRRGVRCLSGTRSTGMVLRSTRAIGDDPRTTEVGEVLRVDHPQRDG